MTGGIANPVRGEVALSLDGCDHVLRPSFAALVAAEGEMGSLLALVDRAAEGRIALSEVAALFWHCLAHRGEWDRDTLGEAVAAAGLARVMPVVRGLLHQILAGTA